MAAAAALLVGGGCGPCFEVPGDGCDDTGGGGGGGGGGGPSIPRQLAPVLADDGGALWIASLGAWSSGDEAQLRRRERDGTLVTVEGSGWRVAGRLALATSPDAALLVAPGDGGGLAARLYPRTATSTADALPFARLEATWPGVVRAAWDGARFLVVLEEPPGVALARVGADGAVIDEPPLRLSAADAWDPWVTIAAGGEALVSWRDAAGLWAQPLDGDGLPVGAPKSLAATGHLVVAAAGGAGEHLLIASTSRESGAELALLRVDAATGAVESERVPDVEGASLIEAWDACLATGPDGYLLVWKAPAGIMAWRLGAGGAALAAPSLVIEGWTPTSYPPAAAWSDGAWVVVSDQVDPIRRLALVTLAADGTPLAPASEIIHDPATGGCGVAPGAGGAGGALALLAAAGLALALARRARQPA